MREICRYASILTRESSYCFQRVLAIAIRLSVCPSVCPTHGNETWDKMGYNSACVRDFCEIFAPVGGFRGWAIECYQFHFSPTDPRCHGNLIWNKMGYNSACLRDFCEIFAPIRGFWGMGHRAIECCQLHFFLTDPRCHGKEIWDKMGYNSACVGDFPSTSLSPSLFSFPFSFPIFLPRSLPLSLALSFSFSFPFPFPLPFFLLLSLPLFLSFPFSLTLSISL